MDNLQEVLQRCMTGLAICAAGVMHLELMCAFLAREKERLTRALDHEPTQENWQDYWQFLGERTLNPKCLQRAEDREKIRRLVYGEDVDNNSRVS